MSFSYKEFPQDVLSAFEKLIKKHKLCVKISEDYLVELSNKYVEISFSFDRGDLYSELCKKNDNYTFAIYQVYKHLYGSVAEDNYKRRKNGGNESGYPKSDLIWFARLFENELSSVLTGNFDWYDELRKEKEYESQLVAVVLGPHLPHPNPISKKMWDGDPTWRHDVEAFIKEKGIKLDPVYNSKLPKPGRTWLNKLFGFK